MNMGGKSQRKGVDSERTLAAVIWPEMDEKRTAKGVIY